MDRRRLQAELVLLCGMALILIVLFYSQSYPSGMILRVEYGEFHANRDGGTGQLFYGTEEEGFAEERSIMRDVNEADNSMEFVLPQLDLEEVVFRLDPFMNAEPFSIASMELYYGGKRLVRLTETRFHELTARLENCDYDAKSGQYVSRTDDPIIYLEEDLGQMFADEWRDYTNYYQNRNLLVFILILLFFALVWTACLLRGAGHAQVRMTRGRLVAVIAAGALMGIGFAASYGVYYLISYFGDVQVEDLLFHMNVPLNGTNFSTFYRVAIGVAVALLSGMLLTCFGDWYLRRTARRKGLLLWAGGLGFAFMGYALWIGYDHIDLASYLRYRNEKTTIYEEYYVDGRDIALVFPEHKRNLIYIFLESMETTYADRESGGAMDENYIPELTELALDHVSFAGGRDNLRGADALRGATFTMGGIAAQTAGIPINTTVLSEESLIMWDYGDSYLFPGVYTIGDALDEAGYRQVFMMGSNGDFGGRAGYLKGHGGYEIIDYYAALEAGWIPEGYYEWWGFEDEKLFAFAREELLSLAESGEPFHLSMLTADTHFTDGYPCRLCGDAYQEQYSNVISCSSAQVYEFVTWIMQQDFYEDTTIVIAGDHLTMDSAYMDRTGVENFDRKVYFTIINPAKGCEDSPTARRCSTFDFFPTTLAALGVQIEGDRLGLGVNLFSETPTLIEQKGEAYLDRELMKYSEFYMELLQ